MLGSQQKTPEDLSLINTIQQPEKILKEYFGYDKFRPMQKDIIEAVLNKKDSLVLMPTGGGKSICYQVPALSLPGICVVVSPLIALMKDQVEALKANGVAAAFLNSSQSTAEQREVEKLAIQGELKLLYVSPEKLAGDGFQWLLDRIKINLFAIDEAHCISFWGHDFRPEYTQLKMLKTNYPNIPVIALTATADKLTRKDILEQLDLRSPEVFIASFDRPNLRLNVLPGLKRMQRILEFLDNHQDEPGIIYCLSRKSTEDIAAKLRDQGYSARPYHAKLPANERARTQEAFLKDDVQIICATIAFGMGIDKSNVRWIIHYNLPKNIENYYQEIGRAGRDGMPAETLLFYTYTDVLQQQRMLEETGPKQRELQEAKLERLKQYAEALFCRRKILLAYFNEDFLENCGNCDVCSEPRKMIDATINVQKALSAVARMGGKGTTWNLVDVLRGARNQTITSKGFHNIKTFGAGRDLKPEEWREYIHQMINLGLMDIAYDEGHVLKINERSKKVLFEGEKVMLVEPHLKYVVTQEKEAAPQKTKKEVIEEALFTKLKNLRKQLADEHGLPPYVVFNDATIREMAAYKPSTKKAMLEITGFGLNKFDAYGEQFIDAIIDFVNEQTNQGNKIKGATHIVTYELLKQGATPEAISKQRNLNILTIYSHIATLYEGSYDVDISKYINERELNAITKVIDEKGKEAKLKDLFEALDGKFEYFKIRLALAVVNKSGQ